MSYHCESSTIVLQNFVSLPIISFYFYRNFIYNPELIFYSTIFSKMDFPLDFLNHLRHLLRNLKRDIFFVPNQFSSPRAISIFILCIFGIYRIKSAFYLQTQKHDGHLTNKRPSRSLMEFTYMCLLIQFALGNLITLSKNT